MKKRLFSQHKIIMLILSLIILVFGSLSYATECLVTRIVDGDTAICGQNRIRLAVIDAPELNQPYGRDAKQCLSDLILNQNINYNSNKKDQYGRIVARCYLNGVDISLYMIKYGCAWAYMTTTKKLVEAQRAAKETKIGLWEHENPIPPWQYRKGAR